MRERIKSIGFVFLMAGAALGDVVLGPRCDLCGARVYVKDEPAHNRIDHAGDRR